MYVMLIYLLLAIYLLAKLQKKVYIPKSVDYAIVGLLALVFLFRYNLGIDFNIYYGTFRDITSPFGDAMHFHMLRNVGFNCIVYLCKLFTNEYRYFVLFSNLLLLVLCGYPILRYSKNVVLSMTLFVGSGILEIYYGSGLRQMFAMAIFFFAYYVFLQHRKYLWYEVACLVGFTFHETILPALILPLIYMKIDWIKAHAKALFLGSLVIGFLVLALTSYVLPIFVIRIVPTLPPFWHMLYYFSEGNQISLMGVLMEVVFLVVILLLYWANDDKKDPFLYLGVVVTWLSVLLYFSLCTHSIVSRMADFYQSIFLILIPNLIENISDTKKKVIGLVGVLILNGYLLHADLTYKIKRMDETFHFGFGYRDYPYVTVFEKDKCDYYIKKILDE